MSERRDPPFPNGSDDLPPGPDPAPSFERTALGDDYWTKHIARGAAEDRARADRTAASGRSDSGTPQALPAQPGVPQGNFGPQLAPRTSSAAVPAGPPAVRVELHAPEKRGVLPVAMVPAGGAVAITPVGTAAAPRVTAAAALGAPGSAGEGGGDEEGERAAPAAPHYPSHVTVVKLPDAHLGRRQQGARVVDPLGGPRRVGAPAAKTQVFRVDPETGEPTTELYDAEEARAKAAAREQAAEARGRRQGGGER